MRVCVVGCPAPLAPNVGAAGKNVFHPTAVDAGGAGNAAEEYLQIAVGLHVGVDRPPAGRKADGERAGVADRRTAGGAAAEHEQPAAGIDRGADLGAAGEDRLLPALGDQRAARRAPPLAPERIRPPALAPGPVLTTVVETASPPEETTSMPPLDTFVL